jgi:hypothetical protein
MRAKEIWNRNSDGAFGTQSLKLVSIFKEASSRFTFKVICSKAD